MVRNLLDDQDRMLRRPIDERVLAELAARIGAAAPTCRVVLFGSHARGDARPDSDVDLLVVLDTDRNPLAVAGELYESIVDREFGVDLVVVTPAKLRERIDGFDPFLNDAVQQGRVLYGAGSECR
ncbi:MAG: nucleotidyltransferase domain-containing protein [Phycisphaerae bacterium]